MQKVDIYIQTTARGPAVRKHVADLWQQYLNVSRGHVISWVNKPHDFSKWMDYELGKMEAEWTNQR